MEYNSNMQEWHDERFAIISECMDETRATRYAKLLTNHNFATGDEKKVLWEKILNYEKIVGKK